MLSLSSATSPQRLDLDRARQVALGDGGGHLGDGAHLRREVGGQQVHVVGQVLPRAGAPGHLGLTAELALGADLARHAGHLIGEVASVSIIVLMVSAAQRSRPCARRR
jgi:hypothetical protein